MARRSSSTTISLAPLTPMRSANVSADSQAFSATSTPPIAIVPQAQIDHSG